MIKVLKSKKGMTLIELIAAMLMFTIIAASVSAVLAPMLKVYAKANELAECNTLLDNVANQIIGDLSNATKMDTTGAATVNVIAFWAGDQYIEYTVDTDLDSDNKGVLLKSIVPDEDGVPVLSKDYYKNKSIEFSCTPDFGKSFTITVTVLSDQDGEMMSRDYAVRPIALNQFN